MLRENFCLVFLLLCFSTGCFSNPVPEKPTVFVSSYEGHIETSTTADPDYLARWTIKAKVSQFNVIHDDLDLVIVKMEDIKTSLFSGKRENLQDAIEKEIPEDSKILEQPFALKFTKNLTFTLLFKPNEPLWSMNMKKGIISQTKFNYEKPSKLPNGEYAPLTYPIEEAEEKFLFGDCNITYTRKSATAKDGVFFEKRFDNFNCTNLSIESISNNVYAPGIKDLRDIVDFKYSEILHIENIHDLKSFHTKANMVYRTSPSTPYTLHIDQDQKSTLIEQHELKETIDTSVFTEEERLYYGFGNDKYSGRRSYEKDSETLAKKYIKSHDEFNKKFSYASVVEDSQIGDPVHEMYEVLEHIDVAGLEKIESYLDAPERVDDFDTGYFFISLLSYIGTNDTVKYLTEFYKTKKVNANSGFSTWTLVTFPQYIQHPSEELLESMEGLMSNPESEYEMAKHAAVFGFARAVAGTCCNEDGSKKIRQKYIDMFHSKYLDGKTYKKRMVHLLGLVNMAPCLDRNLINSILTNSTELSQLRLLAFTGFTEYLQNEEDSNEIYDIYWPIVQKKSEPFDVRVAALNLLLSVKLTEEQFNTILQKYSEDPNEPEDVQLANFVLTTLHSIQNSTGYDDHLGSLASEAIKKSNLRPYPKAWATGHYRLSYTDSVPNVGAAFDAYLITDPKTKVVNTIVLSFNSFKNLFNRGTYTLYLKIEGIFDHGFLKKFSRQSANMSLPQLLKLLKENDFKIRTYEKDVHVDIVLFVDNTAIYANHFAEFDKEHIAEFTNDMEELILDSDFISYPVNDFVHIPSVFGTPILITNRGFKVETHSRGIDRTRIRYTGNEFTVIEAYNPLVDGKISTYKFNNAEMNVGFNYTKNDNDSGMASIIWMNEDDSLTYTWEYNMGTAAGAPEKLKEFCEKCDNYHDISIEEFSSWTNNFEPLGMQFDVQHYKHPNVLIGTQALNDFVLNELYRYNIDAAPFAAPVVLAANFLNYKNSVRSELTKGYIRSKPANSEESTKTLFNLNLWGITRNGFKLSSDVDLRTDITVKNLGDEVMSKVNLTAYYFSSPDYLPEDGITASGMKTVDFYMAYNAPNKNDSIKVCGSGYMALPSIRDDRLSLVPYEASTGEINFEIGKNVDDDEDCVPKLTYTFTEVLSTTDKKGRLQGEKIQKDHEKCLSDSKDLKFTAPTKECRRVADWLTEYDNYKIYMEATKHLEDHNETVIPRFSVIEMSRVDEDNLLLNLTFLKSVYVKYEIKDQSYEVYYPHSTLNPTQFTYNDEDLTLTPDQTRSTCTITPSKIEKFSEKLVSNQKKEWFAFGECYNVSRRGLSGHTIDDKHVGFTFFANDNVLEATVKGGKPDVTLNGKPLTEFYYAEDLSIQVSFLGRDNKAIYVKDDTVEIYYNTEYVLIRVYALYTPFLCGVCIDEK